MIAAMPAARLAPLLLLLAGLATALPAAAQKLEMPFLKGRMLVATPELRDPNFRQAVIYMVEQTEEGAFGLVVNRPIGEMAHADILARLDITGEAGEGKLRIFSGGPVGPDEGYLLHSSDKLYKSSKAVDETYVISAPEEALASIGQGEGPAEALLVLGYAGWHAGQLESELAAGAWEHVPADRDIVFDREVASKWQRAMGLVTIEL